MTTVTLTFPVNDPEVCDIMHDAAGMLAQLADTRSNLEQYDGDAAAAASGGVVVSATDGQPTTEKAPVTPATKTTVPAAPEKTDVPPAAKPTEVEGDEKPSAPAPGEKLDCLGLPHDSRINTDSKATIDKGGKHGPGGSWKVIKGTSDTRREEIRDHWLQLGYGKHLVAGATSFPVVYEALPAAPAATAAAPTTAPAAPTAPAATAAIAAPAAPTAPTRRKLTPQERMLPAAEGVSYQAFKDVVPPWSDQQLIDAGKMSAEEYTEEPAVTEATAPTPNPEGFTTLIVEYVTPNLEEGKITQPQIDAIVSEVTGGVAASVSLISQANAYEHLPAIAARITETVAANAEATG